MTDEQAAGGSPEADGGLDPEVTADPWFTKTWWYACYAAGQGVGCYAYANRRPNLGTETSGVIVWDRHGFQPWELRYHRYLTTTIGWETGAGVASFGSGLVVEEHDGATQVRYTDGATRLDMTFTDVHGANLVQQSGTEAGSLAVAHIDQLGRVTGTLTTDGQVLRLDPIGIRDRTWSARHDDVGVRIGYCVGWTEDGASFLAHGASRAKDPPVRAGRLLADGSERRLSGGERRVSRNPTFGYPEQVVLDAHDEDGLRHRVEGSVVSRMAFMPYPETFVWVSLVRWEWDGNAGWGEDQDVWPRSLWARSRREPG